MKLTNQAKILFISIFFFIVFIGLSYAIYQNTNEIARLKNQAPVIVVKEVVPTAIPTASPSAMLIPVRKIIKPTVQ